MQGSQTFCNTAFLASGVLPMLCCPWLHGTTHHLLSFDVASDGPGWLAAVPCLVRPGLICGCRFWTLSETCWAWTMAMSFMLVHHDLDHVYMMQPFLGCLLLTQSAQPQQLSLSIRQCSFTALFSVHTLWLLWLNSSRVYTTGLDYCFHRNALALN